jgi:hypothetical protein
MQSQGVLGGEGTPISWVRDQDTAEWAAKSQGVASGEGTPAQQWVPVDIATIQQALSGQDTASDEYV